MQECNLDICTNSVERLFLTKSLLSVFSGSRYENVKNQSKDLSFVDRFYYILNIWLGNEGFDCEKKSRWHYSICIWLIENIFDLF